jgi:hypothetical protein
MNGSNTTYNQGTGALDFKSTNNGSTIDLTLIGAYTPADFHAHHQANGSTLITYNDASELDSLRLSAGGARGE